MSNFDLGDALSNIKAVRDAKIQRDFNDQLTDIQEKYSGVIDTEQGIEKLGATTLGFVGTAKSVKDIYNKYKAKVKDFKDKLKSKDQQEDEDKLEGPGEEQGDDVANTEVTGYDPATDPELIANPVDSDNYRFQGEIATEEPERDTFRETLDPEEQDLYDRLNDLDGGQLRRQMNQGREARQQADEEPEPDAEVEVEAPEVDMPSGIGDINIPEDTFDIGPGDLTQALKDTFSNTKDQVMQRVRQIRGEDEPQFSERGLDETEIDVPESELGGGTTVTTEPSGLGSGDIELTDVPGAQQQPSLEGPDPEFTGEGDAIADLSGDVEATSDAVANSATALSNVASGAGEAATTALSAGVEGGIEGGIEAAGAALDASGVGAPIGAILGILGLVVGTATTVGSAVAEGVSSGKEQSETEEAQEQEKQALANPPNYAGKFASQIRGSVAGFL